MGGSPCRLSILNIYNCFMFLSPIYAYVAYMELKIIGFSYVLISLKALSHVNRLHVAFRI